jgi:hypothetical protein
MDMLGIISVLSWIIMYYLPALSTSFNIFRLAEVVQGAEASVEA